MEFNIKNEPELDINEEVSSNEYEIDNVEGNLACNGPNVNFSKPSTSKAVESSDPSSLTVTVDGITFEICGIDEVSSGDEIEITDETPLKQNWQCDLCNTTVNCTSKDFQRHSQMHERTLKDFTNLKNVHDLDVVLCEACFRIKHFKSYKKHLHYYHKDTVPLNRCQDCFKSFRGKILLERHLKEGHELKQYPCNECELVFITIQDLNTHVRRVHWTKACEFCPKSCKTQEALHKHTLKHGSSKWLECPICRYIFALKDNLRRHIELIHTKAKHEKYSCHYCGQEYPSKYMIKHHLTKSHVRPAIKPPDTSPKPAKTPTSSKIVPAKTPANTEDDTIKYNCTACEKLFINRPGLRKHFRTKVHKKVVEDKGIQDPVNDTTSWAIGKHKCCVCGKGFGKYTDMIDHVLAH